MRTAITSLVAALAAAAFAAPAGAAVWSLDQHPAPPPGSQFRVPLGAPGDLQFWAPNRGLVAVEGNGSVARGLFYYDGASWKQLATVCGGASDSTRIAWAGPTDFWTITEPSLPRRGAGLSLCHFVNGEVAASYSTPEESADPFRRMVAATCTGVNECVFGGVGSADPANEREGAFHLRWDGGRLTTSYNPQGRGVSDLESLAGRIFESTFVGPAPEGRATPPTLRTAEDQPRLIHRLQGQAFVNDRFVPGAVADPDPSDDQPAPVDATDLVAMDSDGTDLWAVGGGTLSGAAPPGQAASSSDPYPRGPIAVRLVGDTFREVPLHAQGETTSPFAADERFVDVAAVPGSDRVWVAVQRYADRRAASARGRVARIAPDGTVEQIVTLPTSGSGRGSIAKIAFTSPDEGWAVTSAGWIFQYRGDNWTPTRRDDDPAFANLIDFRPNEAAAQFIPDRPPVDDSQLFAPPPIEVIQEAAPQVVQQPAKQLAALMKNVRSRLRGKRRLVITFTLVRRARIGVVGRRKGKVVARYKTRTLKPGKRTVVVKLDPKRYPTRVSFSIRELDLPQGTDGGENDTGAGSGDTVTTGGGGGGSAGAGAGGGAGDTVTTG